MRLVQALPPNMIRYNDIISSLPQHQVDLSIVTSKRPPVAQLAFHLFNASLKAGFFDLDHDSIRPSPATSSALLIQHSHAVLSHCVP